MIHLIFFAIATIIIAVASVFVYPYYLIVRHFNKKKGDWVALRFVQLGFRFWAFVVGASALYKGLDNLPEDGDAVVFVSNHRSLFDVILTYPAFKGLTGALAKIELKSYPIISWWISSIYGVLLDRKDHRQGMQCVLQCIGHLKNGISILVYPEGTRSHTEGELLSFHTGTFKIATKAGARIIPIAVNGTGDIFDDHRPFFKPHRAVIEFCEPIETKSLTPQELNDLPDRVKSIIQEHMNQNASEVI